MKRSVKKCVEKKKGEERSSVRKPAAGAGTAAAPAEMAYGMTEESLMFSRLRQASRALTNLYNDAMPEVDIVTGTGGPTRRIQVKITQLVVLKALYDPSWWNEMRAKRIGAATDSKRRRLKDYFDKMEGNVVQIDLAHYLNLDCTTICRNLKALVDSGWVKVMRSEVNMRETMIVLTESGRAVVEQSSASAVVTSRRLRETLGDELFMRINEDLQLLTEKIEELKQCRAAEED